MRAHARLRCTAWAAPDGTRDVIAASACVDYKHASVAGLTALGPRRSAVGCRVEQAASALNGGGRDPRHPPTKAGKRSELPGSRRRPIAGPTRRRMLGSLPPPSLAMAMMQSESNGAFGLERRRRSSTRSHGIPNEALATPPRLADVAAAHRCGRRRRRHGRFRRQARPRHHQRRALHPDAGTAGSEPGGPRAAGDAAPVHLRLRERRPHRACPWWSRLPGRRRRPSRSRRRWARTRCA